MTTSLAEPVPDNLFNFAHAPNISADNILCQITLFA